MSSALRILLAVVLALVLSWRGLQWFTDYLDERDLMRPVAAAGPAPAAAPPRPATPAPRLATSDEIEPLASSDLATRWKALELLEQRGSSPELIAALDAALPVDPTSQFHTKVICLRARLSGDDIARFVSGHMPATEPGSQSEEGRLTTCLVNALSRSDTTALEARDILMRFILSPNYERRQAALVGVKRWTFDTLPRTVRDSLFSPSDDSRRFAIHAAAALGALAFQPEVFARALADADQSVRDAAKAHLCRAGTPEAARMLAAAVVEHPDGQRLLTRLGYDFKPLEELWKAFMVIGADENEPEARRVRAIEIVGLKGDRRRRAELEALTQASSDLVRATASAALVEHRRRHP